MTKHHDRDDRRFDDEGNTRPTGSNYISVDNSDDGLDRRGFLRCMTSRAAVVACAMSLASVSMQGPYRVMDVTLTDTTTHEIVWVVGYEAAIVDADSREPKSSEFMTGPSCSVT